MKMLPEQCDFLGGRVEVCTRVREPAQQAADLHQQGLLVSMLKSVILKSLKEGTKNAEYRTI